jgi:hypothetical protein
VEWGGVGWSGVEWVFVGAVCAWDTCFDCFETKRTAIAKKSNINKCLLFDV